MIGSHLSPKKWNSEDEDDDWNLTPEDLDSRETDAVQKIGQLQNSVTASFSSSSSLFNTSIPFSASTQHSRQSVQSNTHLNFGVISVFPTQSSAGFSFTSDLYIIHAFTLVFVVC